jgi:Holliday junction resolvase RusA-like endonuclease
MIDVRLPFPVSTNALFMNRKGGRASTREYKIWQTEAGWELNGQRPKPIKGPVSIVYEFQDGRKLDPDNGIKCVNDLLVRHQLIDGDGPTIVRAGSWSFSDEVVGVRVRVSQFRLRKLEN